MSSKSCKSKKGLQNSVEGDVNQIGAQAKVQKEQQLNVHLKGSKDAHRHEEVIPGKWNCLNKSVKIWKSMNGFRELQTTHVA